MTQRARELTKDEQSTILTLLTEGMAINRIINQIGAIRWQVHAVRDAMIKPYVMVPQKRSVKPVPRGGKWG